MKLLKLKILILLLFCSISIFPQVSQLDSNHVVIDKATFKEIIIITSERNAYKEELKLKQDLIRLQEQEITLLNSKSDNLERNIEYLNKYIEVSKPKWYNNYFTGFISAAIIFTGVIILTK